MESLYRAFGADGRLLYVGITADIEARLMQHRNAGALWVPQFESLSVEYYPTRRAARAAEIQAIRTEWPLYNIDHSIDPWSTKWLHWLRSQRQTVRSPLPLPSRSPEEFEVSFQADLAEVRRIRKVVRDAQRRALYVTSQ